MSELAKKMAEAFGPHFTQWGRHYVDDAHIEVEGLIRMLDVYLAERLGTSPFGLDISTEQRSAEALDEVFRKPDRPVL